MPQVSPGPSLSATPIAFPYLLLLFSASFPVWPCLIWCSLSCLALCSPICHAPHRVAAHVICVTCAAGWLPLVKNSLLYTIIAKLNASLLTRELQKVLCPTDVDRSSVTCYTWSRIPLLFTPVLSSHGKGLVVFYYLQCLWTVLYSQNISITGLDHTFIYSSVL